jgi:hypothetical protein
MFNEIFVESPEANLKSPSYKEKYQREDIVHQSLIEQQFKLDTGNAEIYKKLTQNSSRDYQSVIFDMNIEKKCKNINFNFRPPI